METNRFFKRSAGIWRRDLATMRYVIENREKLLNPEKMKPRELVEAMTYCREADNSYSRELLRRADMTEKFILARDKSDKYEVIKKAAKAFGILLA